MKIKFNRLREDVLLPEYQTDGSAGCDIHALLDGIPVSLGPNQILLVSTGLSVEIPVGYEIQVRSRSGLAMKGLIVLNSPGTIDSDYRGEIKVLLLNCGTENFYLVNQYRIAQLVLARVERIDWTEESLKTTKRGKKGFNSTGL